MNGKEERERSAVSWLAWEQMLGSGIGRNNADSGDEEKEVKGLGSLAAHGRRPVTADPRSPGRGIDFVQGGVRLFGLHIRD